MGKHSLLGRFSLVFATLGPHACFSSHWHRKHRRFRAHTLTPAPTSMDVLGSAVVFSLIYVYVINRFGPITVTHIIIILAVFCAAFIAGVELWQLLWAGLETITSLIGWSIRFIVYACFFIACLVVVPHLFNS
ncbi:hypothetical protein EV421DRAFT_1222393 [Armillaria borealis]|uniref:Uncharacterized protein n=1 Tax=Armillaria borealis TaxID=47425 RepID=A0AA39J5J3_9AGAR|nr:hypothetical protein EV421DRAFT_1222393 [Armillaria borealis]